MAMFDDYYNLILTCMDEYLIEKNDGGWTLQVKGFKENTLPEIAKYKNCVRLHKETELFCKGLCSGFNMMTFGWIGGSQLRQKLEKILSDMVVASESALPHLPELDLSMQPSVLLVKKGSNLNLSEEIKNSIPSSILVLPPKKRFFKKRSSTAAS